MREGVGKCRHNMVKRSTIVKEERGQMSTHVQGYTLLQHVNIKVQTYTAGNMCRHVQGVHDYSKTCKLKDGH